MDAPTNTETELLARLDRRDVKGAATLLVRDHADEVFALCRAMVRDAVVAEDLSQDVFSRAFRALAGFRGEASVRTWVLRIARNRCIDHLRASAREPAEMDDGIDEHPTPEPSVVDLLADREDLARAMTALSENERAMVTLRFGHGLEYRELADTFGLKEGAARMRVSRAVTKMREAIAPTDMLSAPMVGGRSAAGHGACSSPGDGTGIFGGPWRGAAATARCARSASCTVRTASCNGSCDGRRAPGSLRTARTSTCANRRPGTVVHPRDRRASPASRRAARRTLDRGARVSFRRGAVRISMEPCSTRSR